MKYLIILGDGMADYPVEELGGKTPLNVANKPFIDGLAKISEVGLCKTVPDGMKPGSDVANLSVLGYAPNLYYTGRSPLEAASIGIDLKDTDVTLRANLVTLSGNGEYEDLTMADYSAGEISTEEAKILIEYLANNLNTDELKLYSGVSYRHCLVVANGKTGAELTPPHDISDRPIKDYLPKGENANLYLSLMKRSYELLKDHPVNLQRVNIGKRPATSLWFWGEGTKPRLDLFKDKFGVSGAMISAVDLLKGIGKLAGMSVIEIDGATGNYDTNFIGKADGAIDALRNGTDFVYIHMEAPDECGHQGNVKNKIFSIEQIDELVVKHIVTTLENDGEDFAILIMPDHPTPIKLKTHVSDPVPYLLYRSNTKYPSTAVKYDENNAKNTGNYVSVGYEIINKLLSK